MIPFGWSAGDLLGALGVIKKVVDALDESKGAKPEYQNLMKDLYNLMMVLTTLHGIEFDKFPAEQSNALQQSVRECEECVDKFLRDHKKFQSLTAGPSRLADQLRKVQWMSLRQGEIHMFKETLSLRTSFLNMILNGMVSSHTLSSERKAESYAVETENLLGQLLKKHDDASISSAENQRLLQKIENRLKDLSSKEPMTTAQVPSQDLERIFKLDGAPLAPVFVPRPSIMSFMEETLLPVPDHHHTVFVLQGMGGIGKSQMAREYADRHREEYTAVFWVNAKSENKLKTGLAGIAGRIGLKGSLYRGGRMATEETDVNALIAAVMTWFEEDNNTKWLLILDNVDSQVQPDTTVIDEQPPSADASFDICKYMPSSSHGTVIATSRLSYLARSIGGESYLVEQMSSSEGLEVICTLSGRSYDEEGAKTLVDRLGCHPLALSQAGRYIHETQDTFHNYLERYELRLKTLLEQTPSTREYPNGSISATLNISYEALKHRDPSAAALLAFCGCIDNTNILWSLFASSSNIPTIDFFPRTQLPACPWILGLAVNWFAKIQRDEEEYNNVMRSLMAFSFARREWGSQSIRIHPIIHQWSLSLYDDQIRGKFCEVVAELVSRMFWHEGGDGEFFWNFRMGKLGQEHLSVSSSRHHIDRCLSLAGKEPTWSVHNLLSLACYILYFFEQTTARTLVEHAVNLLNESKEPVKPEMIKIRLMVNSMYKVWYQPYEDIIANLESAQIMVQAAEFEDEDQKDEFDHFITENLCADLTGLKRYAEAQEIIDQALKRWRRAGMSPETELQSVLIRMRLLVDIGQNSEAILQGKEIITKAERLKQFDCPGVSSYDVLAFAKYSLGRVYCNVNDWKKGQEHLLFALMSFLARDGIDSISLFCGCLYSRSLLHQTMSITPFKLSPAMRQWNFAISEMVQKHKSTSTYMSQNMRSDFNTSIDTDRWSIVLRIVRLLVRHRKGTAIYDRLVPRLGLESGEEPADSNDPQGHVESDLIVPAVPMTRRRKSGLTFRIKSLFLGDDEDGEDGCGDATRSFWDFGR